MLETLNRLKTQVESAIGIVESGRFYHLLLQQKQHPGSFTIGDFYVRDTKFGVRGSCPSCKPRI